LWCSKADRRGLARYYFTAEHAERIPKLKKEPSWNAEHFPLERRSMVLLCELGGEEALA